MQQSKAHVIKNYRRTLKAIAAMQKAEYAVFRYGSHKPSMPDTSTRAARQALWTVSLNLF